METTFIDQNGTAFNSVEDLINSAMGIPVQSAEEEMEEQNFSHWIIQGDEFFPAENMKLTLKLPNGVYKIVETRDDIKVVPHKINTDELYTFSENFTEKILKEVNEFWGKKDIYKKHKLTHKRGILLCGCPGSGKSSIINLLIKQIIETDGLVFMINNTQEFRLYSQVLKPMVRKIEPERPIITVIEDINQLIDDMGGSDYQLLDFMDGKNTIDHHLIIMTSNDTTSLSEALLRPSRIDLTYEIPNPSEKIRKEYFMKKGLEKEKAVEMAKATNGMSFAQLKEVFIGTEVLGKDVNSVVNRINEPFQSKDYLGKQKVMKGFC